MFNIKYLPNKIKIFFALVMALGDSCSGISSFVRENWNLEQMKVKKNFECYFECFDICVEKMLIGSLFTIRLSALTNQCLKIISILFVLIKFCNASLDMVKFWPRKQMKMPTRKFSSRRDF